MLFYLWSLLVFLPSPLLQFINAEVWAVFVGLSGERSIVLLGLTLGLAQTLGYTLLFLFGRTLAGRWRWLQKRVEAFDLQRFRAHAPWMLVVGSFVGLPPFNAMAIVSPIVGVRLRAFVLISLVGRCVRFIVLGFAAQTVTQLLNLDVSVIPDWLRALI